MEKQKLNELPDELILKIFSFLPMFKKTVATHLISKLWEEPWELVPDVMVEEDVADLSYESFLSFVYGYLLSSDAQILERLHLKLSRIYSASDINFFVQIAVSRSVRKLRIGLYGYTLKLPSCFSACTTLKSLILSEVSIEVVTPEFRLPSFKSLHLLSVNFQGDDESASDYRTLKTLILSELSINDVPCWFRVPSLKAMHLLSVRFLGNESVAKLLRICPFLEDLVVKRTKVFNSLWPTVSACRALKTLILRELSIEVVSPWFCLQSLKSLHLLSVKFLDDEYVASFLQSCPVLEYLVVNKTKDDNVMIFNINVPTLKNLSIDNSKGKRPYVEEIHGFVIKAPALRKFNFKDTFSNFLTFGYMPEVIMADIEVICDQSEKFIGSLTSVQHLSLCSLTSETPYPRGTFFFFLEHLELCTCSAGWWSLLACILKDAPRLRSLKLKSNHRSHYNDPMICFSKPSIVPECLSTHLEIFEWGQYEGKEQERKVAAYILANATCLKMATFSSRCRNKHHRMFRKLKSMDRVSKTCRLVIN